MGGPGCRLEAQFYRLEKLLAVVMRLKELREQTRKNKALGMHVLVHGIIYYAERASICDARASPCRPYVSFLRVP